MITITGQSEGFREAVVAAMASRDFPLHPAVLIDARCKTENPMADELRLRAHWVATFLSRREGSRCAIAVGARRHQYGLARMFSVLLEIAGVHAEIFTDIDQANRWLIPGNGRKTGGASG